MTGKAPPGVWLKSWVKREVGHDTTSFSVVWEDYLVRFSIKRKILIWVICILNVYFIFSLSLVRSERFDFPPRKHWYREFFSSLVLRNVMNQLFFRLSCGCFSSKPMQRHFLYFVIITNYLFEKLYLSFGVRMSDYGRPTPCEPPGHYRNTVADDRTGTIVRKFV